MTATHLLFAAAMAAYVLVAFLLGERDLVNAHPEDAGDRRRVLMLVPIVPQGDVSTSEVAPDGLTRIRAGE